MKHDRPSVLAVPSSKPVSKPASPGVATGFEQAFTLIELLVVIIVLAFLGGLLLPALAATQDRGNRAVCQYHLHQIAVAVTQYAGDNNDYVFPAAANLYPLQFFASDAVAKVGLATNGASIWSCPNRPTLPMRAGNQWIIGYQYYGGITNWINEAGILPSLSPVKLSQSKPYWMLAADVVAQPDGLNWKFSFESNSGWADLPAHHTADTAVPQGGNEVFCDGSVQWIDVHNMYSFHTWTDPSAGGGVRLLYFYQDISDSPRLVRLLPALYRAGVTSPGGKF